MTKEQIKAKELIEFFMSLNHVKMSDYSRIELPTAKQCALKVIYEMESALTTHCQESDELQNMDSTWRYFDNVRKEIENYA